MNPFRDDKAPFIVALILGALGWHVSQITNDIRSARSVAYNAVENEQTGIKQIFLENISNNQYLTDIDLELNCPKGRPCIFPKSVDARSVPPTLLKLKPAAFSSGATLKLYLPAHSTVILTVVRRPGSEFPLLKYSPNPTSSDGIVLLESGSPRVFIARNYLALITYSFGLMLLILILVVFFSAKAGNTSLGEPAASMRPRRRRKEA